MKDPILKGFPFDTVSFAEIVYRVIKSGTVFERAALAKHLTPKSASFFPSVTTQIGGDRDNLQTAIDDIFKPMFRRLTDHFGVPFNGDQDSVAYSLISEYGGLSFADFLIFFERAKTGRYRKEFQHIATRGINAEFLTSWIDQYLDEKNEDLDEMYLRFKNPTPIETSNPETAEGLRKMREAIEQRKKDRAALENQVVQLRGEFEAEVYQTAAVKQWFKWHYRSVQVFDEQTGDLKTDKNGSVVMSREKVEIPCSEADTEKTRFEMYPIRVLPLPGAERLVKRAIFEFVKFGDSAGTVQFYDEYKERVLAKYKGEDNIEDHFLAELKIVISTINQVKRKFLPEAIIESNIRKSNPGATARAVSEYVYKTISNIEDGYYDQYLPWCIERGYPGLKKPEYILSIVLEIAVKDGLVNPFKSVFE